MIDDADVVREEQAKAEAHMSELQPLVPSHLFDQLLALYAKLNTRWSWSLQSAKEQSQLYEDLLPELTRIRGGLTRQIELKLGRS